MKRLKKIKTLILDYSKWRCGGDNKAKLGKGQTRLLNHSGYMCCLGQWALQAGAKDKDLKGVGVPRDIENTIIPLLSKFIPTYFGLDRIDSTDLSNYCIEVNDNDKNTPEDKIKLLRAKLKTKGVKMRVINRPKK